MKLAESRVLLTGAGGGIGHAMAQALRAQGAAVMGVGRRETAPAALPAGTAWVRGDLATDAGRAAVAAAAAHWRANVLVHAAGVAGFGAVDHFTPERMAEVLQVNLLAPMALTHVLLPWLRSLPEARIVFVGSALGAIGVPGFGVYGASKAGLHAFAEALRRELAGTPVRVQLLAPRATDTALNSADAQRFNHATGTAVDPPERVATALLALLAGDAAERFVGWPERLAVRLNGLRPTWLDGSFGRHRRSLAAVAAGSTLGERG